MQNQKKKKNIFEREKGLREPGTIKKAIKREIAGNKKRKPG